MSFKTKFAQALNAADQVLTTINPIFGLFAPGIAALGKPEAAAVTKVGGEIDTLIGIVSNMEAMKLALNTDPTKPVLTGAQAAQAIAPQVAQVILRALSFRGKKPKDSDLFKAQSAQLAGIISDMTKNFEG